MTRAIDLDAARDRLLGWLRLRAGRWLTTSDHQLAKVAGLVDSDSGMRLLQLLATEGVVEIARADTIRSFRLLQPGEAPIRPPAPPPAPPPPDPEPEAPMPIAEPTQRRSPRVPRRRPPPAISQEASVTDPTPKASTGAAGITLHPSPKTRERFDKAASAAGTPLGPWIVATAVRALSKADAFPIAGEARLRPALRRAAQRARHEGVDLGRLLGEVIDAGLIVRENDPPVSSARS